MITNRMVRRRLSLPFTDIKEDDEVIADEEINKRKLQLLEIRLLGTDIPEWVRKVK